MPVPNHCPNNTLPAPIQDAPSNRLTAILAHVPWYSIQGPARLADDVGVSRSTIGRVLNGQRVPSFPLMEAIVQAIEKRVPYPLPIEEVFATNGRYPTGSTCDLCDCDGCLPECAYDRRGRLRPAWKDATTGEWCRYPQTEDSHPKNPLITPHDQ